MKRSDIAEQSDARGKHECRANKERLTSAEALLREALLHAAVEGFYGKVKVSVTFQDGVAQKVDVENRRVIR